MNDTDQTHPDGNGVLGLEARIRAPYVKRSAENRAVVGKTLIAPENACKKSTFYVATDTDPVGSTSSSSSRLFSSKTSLNEYLDLIRGACKKAPHLSNIGENPPDFGGIYVTHFDPLAYERRVADLNDTLQVSVKTACQQFLFFDPKKEMDSEGFDNTLAEPDSHEVLETQNKQECSSPSRIGETI